MQRVLGYCELGELEWFQGARIPKPQNPRPLSNGSFFGAVAGDAGGCEFP